jgi:glycine/D-amino acid oxidase-like deaminating enzyme
VLLPFLALDPSLISQHVNDDTTIGRAPPDFPLLPITPLDLALHGLNGISGDKIRQGQKHVARRGDHYGCLSGHGSQALPFAHDGSVRVPHAQLVTPAEVRRRCALMDVTDVLGALYDPMEGYLDPYSATIAFSKAARLQGAEIYRHARVLELAPTGRGAWRVVTSQGTIEAEHVVNAAGLWAREVGLMVGVNLPLVPIEHHYLITEDIPEIAALERGLPLVVDLDGEMYMRPEGRGLPLGVYEKDATPWARDGTSWEFGDNELLAPNLDRLTDSLERGFRRFPCLNRAGIRKIVNGPFTFSPDGNPLVGPVPGAPNFWSACGVMAGFAQGGGVGLTLAQWMVEGEPDGDVFALDVARFGAYATRGYVAEKVLRTSLPHRLSERILASRATHEDIGAVRESEGRERGLRRQLRIRSAAVLRAPGRAGSRKAEHSALRCLPAGSRGVSRRTLGCNRARCVFVREVRGGGPACGRRSRSAPG